MTKQELDEKLFFIATNAPHRVHDLFNEVRGINSDDPAARQLLAGLHSIASRTNKRTDLAVWNEVMDLRHGEGSWKVAPQTEA